MNASGAIAAAGTLLGDPSRARILEALLDGGALTATELALHAGISGPTASAHLARLTAAGLLAGEARGRYRYYRLAGAAVAQALEALSVLALRGPAGAEAPGAALEPLRVARTCYDHLAGRLGVALTRALVRRRYLVPRGRDFRLSPAGAAFLAGLGVDVARARAHRRAFARQCVDWTEQEPHLAGALGAAVAACFLASQWVRRVPDQRYLTLTPRGRSALTRLFRVKPAVLSRPR